MISKWESKKERLLHVMEINPLLKMEWLREMNDFFLRNSSKRTKAIRRKLREMR